MPKVFVNENPTIELNGGLIALNPYSLNFTGNVSVSNTGPYVTINVGGGSGFVSTVGVATANGFAGSSSGGTNPILTLSTTVSGILKGNGTAISAATASDITGQLLTGYASSPGTISATDSILTAIGKLNGNISGLVTGVSSVSNSDGTLTITPTTGSVVASLALGHANTWTGQQTFNTSAPIFGTMTNKSVLFAGTSGLLSQDNSFFQYDSSTHRLSIGTTSSLSTLTLGGQESWAAGIGSITHILGPSDATLAIASQSPVASTSSLAGNNLTITAATATAGTTGNTTAAGGNITITSGVNVTTGSVTVGSTPGSINLVVPDATSTATRTGGGAINITAGKGFGSSTSSGAVNISGGSAPTGSQTIGGGLVFQSGAGGNNTSTAAASGLVQIFSGLGGDLGSGNQTAGASGDLQLFTSRGGNGTSTVGQNGGNAGTASLTGGTGGSTTVNNSGITVNGGTGGIAALVSGTGGAVTAVNFGIAISGPGGAMNLTLGNGGAMTITGAQTGAKTLGRAGDFTLQGGNGGAMTGTSGITTITGGRGSNISFLSGNGSSVTGPGTNIAGAGGGFAWTGGAGGSATSGTSNTGGSSGSMTWTILSPGTGSTANGTLGQFSFIGSRVNFAASTTTYPSIVIPTGTAATTLADGYVWQDGTHAYMRVGTITKQLDNETGQTTVSGTVSTTNATPTQVLSVPVPVSTTVSFEITVVARRTGGTAGTAEDGGRVKLQAVYKNVAGTATIIGSVTSTPSDFDQAWTAAFAVYTGNVIVNVTGATNNNIDWLATGSTVSVS